MELCACVSAFYKQAAPTEPDKGHLVRLIHADSRVSESSDAGCQPALRLPPDIDGDEFLAAGLNRRLQLNACPLLVAGISSVRRVDC
jgi:hypothetical protein